MRLVVSQPMFLPWVGLFEQIRLADLFLHYTDVQLPQGRSFVTRVQIKTQTGSRWLTAPVDRARSGRTIAEAVFLPAAEWRSRHLAMLHHAYARAPFATEMMDLAERIYAADTDNVSAFNIHAIETVAHHLGLDTVFGRTDGLHADLRGTDRLVALCRSKGATRYVTGHGALNYLDHAAFETRGIAVEYMQYRKLAYSQQHGDFTPFVTILDAIAALGPEAATLLRSQAIDRRDFASVNS